MTETKSKDVELEIPKDVIQEQKDTDGDLYRLPDGSYLLIYLDENDTDYNPLLIEWGYGPPVKVVAFHGRYSLSSFQHCLNHGDYTGWGQVEVAIRRKFDPVVIKPLYLYSHSGITVSTSPFSCPWDSGQVGFVFVPRNEWLRDQCRKRMSKKLHEKADKYLDKMVSLWDLYLQGEVYRFSIFDRDGNIVDTCGGFLGCDPEASGLLEHIDMEKEVFDTLTPILS